MIGDDKPMPRHLRFTNKASDFRLAPASLPIPDNFLATTIIRDEAPGVDERGVSRPALVITENPFKEYLKEWLYVVIVNQTEDDLILALQVGNKFEWKLPSREGRFLPFLWKIPKKVIMKSLDGGSGQ